jgi:hypothetical protein
MALESGTHLGPYRIVGLLGVGGMGEVYRARDDRLNRMVALKVLPADRVANAERLGRFIQEAQLASSLQHPNIVTIFDIGSAEGGEYLAMELVRGRTLDTLIPQVGLPLQDALRYAIQILDALAAAHAAGIVHRDLKPGNIMVTDQDQIKIWRMSADGTDPVQVTKQGASTVAASRDGEWIFYQALTPPLFIHRARPDGSDDSVVVAEDVRIGMFAPTARGLWFVTNPTAGQAAVVLKMMAFADRTVRQMANVDFVPIPVGLSVSPDERYALITRGDRNGSDLLLVNEFR